MLCLPPRAVCTAHWPGTLEHRRSELSRSSACRESREPPFSPEKLTQPTRKPQARYTFERPPNVAQRVFLTSVAMGVWIAPS